MSNCSDALRIGWRRIPDSFQPPMNPKPRRWVSVEYRFRAMTPRAPPASSVKSSVGSRTLRNGAPGVKAKSAFAKGQAGIRRWVGLGVIADNVIHIGTHLAQQARSR